MPNIANLPTADVQSGAAWWSAEGYIDGLNMTWDSTTGITVSSGSAWIESLAKIYKAPSSMSLTGLSLTASTFYHVYLYYNAGTPAIEAVTTSPASPYNGTARSKTGDTSRRYVGSILTDATGNIYNFLHDVSRNVINYVTDLSGSPFKIVTGSATTATSVSCASVVPATTKEVNLFVANNDTAATVYLGNSNMIPTSSAFIAYVATTSVYPITFPLDASLSFQYLFNLTPTNTFVARVSGYVYER